MYNIGAIYRHGVLYRKQPLHITIRIIIGILTASTILLLLAGCSNQNTGNRPVVTIEAYLKALVAKDANQVITLSCAAWEEQARQELRSFDANSMSLNDLQCQEIERQGDAVLVQCTGTILANYGAEEMSIDLSSWIYKVIQEGGEWRMCGYQE
jgi:hypothetical protein